MLIFFFLLVHIRVHVGLLDLSINDNTPYCCVCATLKSVLWFNLFFSMQRCLETGRPVCILKLVLHISTFPAVYMIRFINTTYHAAKFRFKIPRYFKMFYFHINRYSYFRTRFRLCMCVVISVRAKITNQHAIKLADPPVFTD